VLRTSAIGGRNKKLSPPRTEKGDPHPGRRAMNKSHTAGATNERPAPSLLMLTGRLLVSEFNTGGISALIVPKSFPLQFRPRGCGISSAVA
jgi:hypothetical protein